MSIIDDLLDGTAAGINRFQWVPCCDPDCDAEVNDTYLDTLTGNVLGYIIQFYRGYPYYGGVADDRHDTGVARSGACNDYVSCKTWVEQQAAMRVCL